MIVFLSAWDACVTYLSEILMFLFIVLGTVFDVSHRFGILYFHWFQENFPLDFPSGLCLSVGASESRVQPAPKFLCGLLWAMCPVDQSASWSLSIAQGHYSYPCGQRSNRTTEVLPYPVSGRHLCLYVCGAMILYSTNHTLVLEGKVFNPLYSTQVFWDCSFTLTQKGIPSHLVV